MLRDQTFSRPIAIAFGAELFRSSTALFGYNSPLVSIFRNQVQAKVSSFNFWYVAESNPQSRFIAEMLNRSGVNLHGSVLYTLPDMLTEVSAILALADVVYSDSLFKQIPTLSRRLTVNCSPEHFIEGLARCVDSPAPFEIEVLREVVASLQTPE